MYNPSLNNLATNKREVIDRKILNSMGNIANMLLTKKKRRKEAEKITGVSNMFKYTYTCT